LEFAADRDGLWVAVGSSLMHVDFELRTNLLVSLPISPATEATCLLVGSTNVWIGTDGAGLLEFNKATHTAVHYGEKEGLLTDVIAALRLGNNRIWIAYGYKNPAGGIAIARKQTGGLGQFDICQKQFRFYSPSLAGGPISGPTPAGPPASSVAALAVGGKKGEEIWLSASPLRRLRSDSETWEPFPQAPSPRALEANAEYLFTGNFRSGLGEARRGPVGIHIYRPENNTWSSLKDFGFLPGEMVTALTLEGDNLWAAGTGYVAKLDPRKNELLNYAFLKAYTVDRIEAAGGYLWVHSDRRLHRGKLP
jgi:hypothetical protein